MGKAAPERLTWPRMNARARYPACDSIEEIFPDRDRGDARRHRQAAPSRQEGRLQRVRPDGTERQNAPDRPRSRRERRAARTSRGRCPASPRPTCHAAATREALQQGREGREDEERCPEAAEPTEEGRHPVEVHVAKARDEERERRRAAGHPRDEAESHAASSRARPVTMPRERRSCRAQGRG